MRLVFRDNISTKGSGQSISSSNRSTSIQQTVPVPIALSIPSSSSSSSVTSTSSSSATTNPILNQQPSQLLSSLEAATAVAAMRQQASPLQQFLGPGLSSLNSCYYIYTYMCTYVFIKYFRYSCSIS